MENRKRGRLLPSILVLFLVAILAGSSFGATYRVLFDNTKSETAGNADWVIDDNSPDPSPAAPASAEDWTGAISSWGYGLYTAGGYSLKTLPAGRLITYGNTSDPLDLSNFDVFVMCEPNNKFQDTEKAALISFVQNGGGLFLIADHAGADRDNDGMDARQVLNDFFTVNTVSSNLFGVLFDSNSITDTTSNIKTDLSYADDAAILNGSFGAVTGFSYNAGATMTVDSGANSAARALIWKTGATQGNTQVMAAISRLGNGRVVIVGDSSPADDGNGSPGNELYNGWTAAGTTNSFVFLNGTKWLAEGSGGTTDTHPSITGITSAPYVPASSEAVTISAVINDDHGLNSVKLQYSVSGGAWNDVVMSGGASSTFTAAIPGQPDGTPVQWRIQATDTASQVNTSAVSGYFAGTTPVSTLRANDSNGAILFSGFRARISGTATIASGIFNATSNDVYVQDSTGGVDIWQSGSINPSVVEGSWATVQGLVLQYNGKLEMDISTAPASMTVSGSGAAPAPVAVAATEISESREGMLVRLEGMTVKSGTFPAANADGTLVITDGSGHDVTMGIAKGTDIDGTATPTVPFAVIGIVVQKDNTSPFDSGYQIMPRKLADIIRDPNADSPPVLGAIGSKNVMPGQTLTFDVTATDPDTGDTLTYSASNLPANATFSGQTFAFTPAASQDGQTFTVTFLVEDGRGGSDSENVAIAVSSQQPQLVINEILADPGTVCDANGDGKGDSTQDEFVELVNAGAAPLDISGWTLSDAVQVRHVFAANTVLPAGGAIVVFGGGTPTGTFGGSLVCTASTKSLGLNNPGDTVTIKNGSTVIATYTYGAEGGKKHSITRNPDITGSFVEITTIPAAGGRTFSAGTKVDGTPFGAVIPSARGDLDKSGDVDALDLTILQNYLDGSIPAGTPPFTANLDRADVDASGSVDATDMVALATYLIGVVQTLPTL